jgi:hypothetical protein
VSRDERWLAEYRRRHPHLFPDEPTPTPGPAPPRSNGYENEAAFQADAVRTLCGLGWSVQENLKGSAGNGPVYYGKGWPDLDIYMEDGRRRIWYAELKQPGNKPTDDQLACHARLRRAGFRVIVAYTLDDLLTAQREERL